MYMNNFYDDAVKTAALIKEQYPGFAENPNAAISVILTNEDEIFAGVTGIGIYGESIVGTYAELAAAASMKAVTKAKAVKMISFLLTDMSIIQPEQNVVMSLFDMNSIATNCELFTSTHETISAAEFTGGASFFDGFDDDVFGIAPPSVPINEGDSSTSSFAQNENEAGYSGMPSQPEFSGGVVIDESNPFYAPSDEGEQNNDVKFFAQMPGGDAPNAAPGNGLLADSQRVDLSKVFDDEPEISKHDLLKQAKQKKKIAKAKFGFRR